ncbi:MAG: AraC family transcriptional regulator [Lachnospiraceae bacterium]|nr:AraC family transcriptional regulator [Lachnospiraceae bacterium]
MESKFSALKDIYVDKVRRQAGFAMPEDHFHPYFELYYVREGKCCFFLNDTLYSLNAGDFMLIAPGDLHHTLYLPEEDCERITIYFNKEHISQALPLHIPDFEEKMLHSGQIMLHYGSEQEVLSLLDRMLAEYRLLDGYSRVLLLSYLQQLFCLIMRHRMEDINDLGLSSRKDDEVLFAAKYIYRNFASSLTLEEVAGAAGLSPTYFSKKFKQVTGLGFKEYVNFVRMKNAAQELLATKHSVTDVALNNGFSDGNYFKDAFKKVHGCSPREYRKRL